MIFSQVLREVSSLFNDSTMRGNDALVGYTDPLVFAIPVALVVIVGVVVISASSITKQQNRIRNEDRLLDTLERIRQENAEVHREDQNLEAAMRHLEEANQMAADGQQEALPETPELVEEVTLDDDISEDEFDEEFDEDEEDFVEDEDEEDVHPEGVICDDDGFCYAPSLSPELIAAAKEKSAAQETVVESEETTVPEEDVTVDAQKAATTDTEAATDAEPESEESVETPPVTSAKKVLAAEEITEAEEIPAESTTDAAAPRSETKNVNGVEEETAAADVADEVETAAATANATAKLEKPEPKLSRLQRLKARLAGRGDLGKAMLTLLSRAEISPDDWQDLEDILLAADLGIEPSSALIERLQTRQKVEGTSDPQRVREMAKEELLALLEPEMDRGVCLVPPEDEDTESQQETVGVLMVGVNGAGKTTTVGKLARYLVAEGHSVVLGAADTFRAAAGEQLQTWGDRVGVEVVRSKKDKADPASVAFDAAKAACEKGADVVLIDTAGRLQNKSGLMDELGKIKRVAEKQVPITEVLLVIDATTGQNALSQAKEFTQAVGVTGIVLTKLDGSAKGGIVVSVQRELGLPVKFVGLGEGPDDLAPFVAADFVDALLEA